MIEDNVIYLYIRCSYKAFPKLNFWKIIKIKQEYLPAIKELYGGRGAQNRTEIWRRIKIIYSLMEKR